MSTVQSVERAFRILGALAAAPAGVTELAAGTGLPKSTVARLLATLESIQAVDRDENAEYRIGPVMRLLTGSLDARSELIGAVRPHLEHLAELTGEAAGLNIPEGYATEYAVQVESPNPVQVRDYTGLTLPMHVGPGGLVIMAHWPAEQVRHYLRRPLEEYTPQTVIDPQQIEARLEDIRREGHAWVYEEFAEGINSVAAAILDPRGRVLGSLTVHGPSYRFPESGDETKIATQVKEAASRLSSRLALTAGPATQG